MALRPLRLPDDFEALMRIMPIGFQYPDHPEWDMQADEQQNFLDTMGRLRQLWPVLSILSAISADVRATMGGFCWEENGQVVAIAMLSREGPTRSGQIANLMVLPAYRRRGIGRALVKACIDRARQRGDQAVVLDVAADNQPARALYAHFGFVPFAELIELEFGTVQPLAQSGGSADPPQLPHGYQHVPLPRADWRARLEIDGAVIPLTAQQFEPVEQTAYQPPLLLRPLLPILESGGGQRQQSAVLHSGLVIGWSSCYARLRPGGVNHISVSLHPAHPALAPWLVHHALQAAQSVAPGRRTELMLPSWQPVLLNAALQLGFTQVTTMVTMGLPLQTDASARIHWPVAPPQPHSSLH